MTFGTLTADGGFVGKSAASGDEPRDSKTSNTNKAIAALFTGMPLGPVQTPQT